jgi:hypothetical protein
LKTAGMGVSMVHPRFFFKVSLVPDPHSQLRMDYITATREKCVEGVQITT